MLTLAQEKLAKGDFDKAKSLGAVTGALGKLGVNSHTASKFVPAVTKFVGKSGGKDLGAELAAALK